MASSLGTLTLDLIARIGGFTAPLDKAEVAARKSGKGIAEAADMASVAWDSLKEVIAGALAGFSAGAVLTTFITNTIDAEKEQAQLAAVLKSTGSLRASLVISSTTWRPPWKVRPRFPAAI